MIKRAAEMVRAWHPVLPALAAFAVASGGGMALLTGRYLVTGHARFTFLPWNLLLAWMPFFFALGAWRWFRSAPPQPRRGWLCSAGWLVFFPNAPYLCTDMVHLFRVGRAPASLFWFDLVMLLTFAFTGLLLGFASLAVMQSLVARARGWLFGWLFAAATLGMAGFGIYLGRFLRWHSWDVLRSPLGLTKDIADRLFAPWECRHTWGFSLLVFAFLFLNYVICQALTRLSVSQSDTPPSAPS
jgi:uncharacterized membrane protein